MKSTGVVRKLDDLGRITLPIELRRNLNIGEHDPLEIFVDDDRIILRKYEASDIFTAAQATVLRMLVQPSLVSALLLAQMRSLAVALGLQSVKALAL